MDTQTSRHHLYMSNQHHSIAAHPAEVTDTELLEVIADFLDMGHVDNIIAMFRQDPRYYSWTGRLLTDERFAVRLGVSVLFEHLKALSPNQLPLAIPSLSEQLTHPVDWVRGEAASVLGIIATEEALALLHPLLNDASPQVVEIVHDILELDFNG
jgi:HEAT repeat protein